MYERYQQKENIKLCMRKRKRERVKGNNFWINLHSSITEPNIDLFSHDSCHPPREIHVLMTVPHGQNMVPNRQGVVLGEDPKDVVGGLSGLLPITPLQHVLPAITHSFLHRGWKKRRNSFIHEIWSLKLSILIQFSKSSNFFQLIKDCT